MGFPQAATLFFLLTAASLPAYSATSSPGIALPGAGRQLMRHQVEIRHLQHDVAKQEADSKRASARLQQQDKTIADLQRRLQELAAHSASAQH